MRHSWLPPLAAVALSACSVADSPAPGAEPPPAAPGFDVVEVADALCSALFRCCDGSDVEQFFDGYATAPALADQAGTLPPTESACPVVVADLLDVQPFGDWVRATEAGRVVFVPSAYDACLDTLESAACGDEVRAALYDESCFGFAAGAGRGMFDRTEDSGPCSPLRDGVGASFYGTCDPSQAFCCYGDGCTNPYDGENVPRAGTCRPASGVGEPCSPIEPYQLCRTGLTCDGDTGRCEEPGVGPLAVGEPCADDDWSLLGECVDSWCDLFGDRTCQPPRSDGEACLAPFECASGVCDGTCVPNEHCSG